MGGILAAVLLCGMLAGCGAKVGGGTQEDLDILLLQTAVAQAVSIGEMASNEVYRSAYTSDDKVLALMEEMGRQDHTAPQMALWAQVDEGEAAAALKGMMSEEADIDFDTLPREVQQSLEERMVAAYPSLLASQRGFLAIAAGGALSSSISLPRPELLKGACYVILLYEEDWAVFTLYLPGQEDTMMAYTTPVLLDEVARETLEGGELPGVADGLPMGGVTVTQMSGGPLAERLAAAA